MCIKRLEQLGFAVRNVLLQLSLDISDAKGKGKPWSLLKLVSFYVKK
jgi:hypothetical protein